MKNAQKPAHPVPWKEGENKKFEYYMDGTQGGSNYGLTKFEYFTAKALEGLCANPYLAQLLDDNGEDHPADVVATMAIRSAQSALRLMEENQ